jgi:hypothetical protein
MKIFKIMSVVLLIYNSSLQAADLRGPEYNTVTDTVNGIKELATTLSASASTEQLGSEELLKLQISYQLLKGILQQNGVPTTSMGRFSRKVTTLIGGKKS